MATSSLQYTIFVFLQVQFQFACRQPRFERISQRERLLLAATVANGIIGVTGASKDGSLTYDSGGAPSKKSGSCHFAPAPRFAQRMCRWRCRKYQILVRAWRT